MKNLTFNIRDDQVKALRELSKKTGIPQSFLIRLVIDDLLKDKEKLKKRLFDSKENVKKINSTSE